MRYASCCEGDWFQSGLASQTRNISPYVTAADPERGYLAESYRDRLSKADIGRSCMRIRRLGDVDLGVVGELVRAGAAAYDRRGCVGRGPLGSMRPRVGRHRES